MTWILLVVMLTSGRSPFSQEFNTEQACRVAQAQIASLNERTIFTSCVPKGEER